MIAVLMSGYCADEHLSAAGGVCDLKPKHVVDRFVHNIGVIRAENMLFFLFHFKGYMTLLSPVLIPDNKPNKDQHER